MKMLIEITVEGPPKCGKSALVEVIRRHLIEHDISVEIKGEDGGSDVNMMMTPSYEQMHSDDSVGALCGRVHHLGTAVEIHT